MKQNKKRIELSWCLYDWANSGFATVILAAVLPVYFVSLVPRQGGQLLPFSSHYYSATSIWGYSVAVAMLGIAMLAPTLGYLADLHGSHKRWLTIFCLCGSIATGNLYFASDQRYWLAAILFIGANFSFVGANIFYNAYLPHLTTSKDIDSLSSRGYAYGYLGGGILLALVFMLITKSTNPSAMTRMCFVLTGLWWLLWSLPVLRNLPKTKPNPDQEKYSLTKYVQQFKTILSHRDLALFLLAFLFYNDGIQTLISVSAIYAREELGFSQGVIMGCFLMVQFLAMPGALICSRLSGLWGAKTTILACLILFIAVSIFAYRMTSAIEFWILGAVIAIILGGSQALSRSLYASMIPPEKAGELFGFFAISSKFAAIFGPLIFAIITDLTGNSRQGILALGLFFLIGGSLLLAVNVQRGQLRSPQ